MDNKVLIGIVAIVIVGIGVWAYTSKSDTAPMAQNDTNSKVVTNTTSEKPMVKEAPKPEGVMVGGALMTPNLDIVDNAVNAKNVTTVVAAVKAAGLVDTLKSAGPFTVFAPTNAAFEKLPAGTVETLLKPENKATLTKILTYHVVAGRYTAADLKDGQELKTVQGGTIKITKKDGKIMVNGTAMVETADVISQNGVTFVIDGVLMPK